MNVPDKEIEMNDELQNPIRDLPIFPQRDVRAAMEYKAVAKTEIVRRR